MEFSMRALTWHGSKDIRCDEVPDPRIEDSRDAILKVTCCAICGSDLHLYDGWPDTFSQGPDGTLYVTASHIQDSPWFHLGWTDKHFALFSFTADGATSGTRK
jgi:hypothetical protein